ncbi:MAG: hypothetical protein ABIJ44_01770 [Pseudomonadota bacterium]
MKKFFLPLIPAVILLFSGMCLANPPHQVGGFILGKNVADYSEILRMETSLPIRYMEYISEVEIKKTAGFKTGIISYGTCAAPGRIVRVRLKYADPTKGFYDKLLALFRKQFGKPTEWRGDPFNIIIAWKWSFTDNENNKISLILHHNTKDSEEKLGNVVKLTMLTFVEEEYRCFQKKHPETLDGPGKQELDSRGEVNWDLFVPR